MKLSYGCYPIRPLLRPQRGDMFDLVKASNYEMFIDNSTTVKFLKTFHIAPRTLIPLVH